MQVILQIISLLFYPIIFIFLVIYFFTTKIFSLLFIPFQKNLQLSQSAKKLNGISIIIPTWNKKDFIINCLKQISQLKLDLPFELIIIENGSTDGSLEAIEKFPANFQLQILAQKTNLGFAPAINLAAKKAKYNYLYLMNNDMVLKKDTLAQIITFAQSLIKKNQPFFSLASQVFFFDPTKKREESGKTYASLKYGFLRVAHVLDEKILQENSPTLYAGGGSSLFNKSLFLQLGGYDAASYKPLYGEDLDLGFLAWRCGFPSYYCAASQIIHHHRSSTVKLQLTPDFMMRKNFLVFLWKNLTSPFLIIQHLLLFPLLMIIKPVYASYFFADVKNLPDIFCSRLKTAHFKTIYSDQEIFHLKPKAT